jgi:hypothetical protein
MVLFLLNTPGLLFEVMDKEASLEGLWLTSLVLGIGGFLLARYRYRWLLLVVPIALFFAYDQISEIRDPSVGPHIVREAGQAYVTHSYVAVTVAFALPLVGAIIWRMRRTSLAKPTP